jgi:hypothetical protein
MRLLLQISVILLSPALIQSACFVGAPKRVGRARRPDSTRVLARAPPSSGPGFSYVDGDNFENAEDEVLAMGGDPFFLGLDDDSKVDDAPPSIEGKTNLQLDPDTTEPKKWEWDGEVDDEAHLDLY